MLETGAIFIDMFSCLQKKITFCSWNCYTKLSLRSRIQEKFQLLNWAISHLNSKLNPNVWVLKWRELHFFDSLINQTINKDLRRYFFFLCLMDAVLSHGNAPQSLEFANAPEITNTLWWDWDFIHFFCKLHLIIGGFDRVATVLHETTGMT